MVEVRWDRSFLMFNRLKGKNPYGRHIIRRDTRILFGVYPGGTNREVLVVDPVKYPALGKLYKKVLLRSLFGFLGEKFILRSVYSITKKAMKYDDEAVDRFISYNYLYGRKVSIDQFINKGIGVCRHMGLVCGALLEMLTMTGYLDGKVSVDRNTIDHYAHVWARYTSKDGKVIILDVAQGFFGSPYDPKARWDYRREGEKVR